MVRRWAVSNRSWKPMAAGGQPWRHGPAGGARGRRGWAIGPSDRLGGVPADPPAAALPAVAEAPSLVALISQGVLDAELGALVWLLVEGRIPLLVATPEGRA